TADQDDRMLLQVVPYAGNISRHFVTVREPRSRHLAQGRVRLLGRGGLDLRADPAFLRRALQGRRAGLVALLYARAANKLVDSRHVTFFFFLRFRPARNQLGTAPAPQVHTALLTGYWRLTVRELK